MTVISSGCKSEDVVPILNPPMGLRHVVEVFAGRFSYTTANKAVIQSYYGSTKFIEGLIVDTAQDNCIIIEFYAYNTETGFNGYNIYAMGGHAYANLAEAWQDFVANLTLYQSAHSGPSPANPLYPVYPGTISSPYYASIASSSVSFSGGLTKIAVVFHKYSNYNTGVYAQFVAGTYYIGVTAVSITEGSIYESLPSNIIAITLP